MIYEGLILLTGHFSDGRLFGERKYFSYPIEEHASK